MPRVKSPSPQPITSSPGTPQPDHRRQGSASPSLSNIAKKKAPHSVSTKFLSKLLTPFRSRTSSGPDNAIVAAAVASKRAAGHAHARMRSHSAGLGGSKSGANYHDGQVLAVSTLGRPPFRGAKVDAPPPSKDDPAFARDDTFNEGTHHGAKWAWDSNLTVRVDASSASLPRVSRFYEPLHSDVHRSHHPAALVGGPSASQATLRAGLSEDMLKGVGPSSLVRQSGAIGSLPRPSTVPAELRSPIVLLTDDVQRVQVLDEYERDLEAESKENYPPQPIIAALAPRPAMDTLEPMTDEENSRRLVPLAIQPPSQYVPPSHASARRGSSTLSLFRRPTDSCSSRRSSIRSINDLDARHLGANHTNLSTSPTDDGGLGTHAGRRRPSTQSSLLSTSLDFAGWGRQRSFVSGSSMHANARRKQSLTDPGTAPSISHSTASTVTFNSMYNFPPSAPHSVGHRNSNSTFGHDIDLSRRRASAQEHALKTQSYLSVADNVGPVGNTKRSRSVDFGIYRSTSNAQQGIAAAAAAHNASAGVLTPTASMRHPASGHHHHHHHHHRHHHHGMSRSMTMSSSTSISTTLSSTSGASQHRRPSSVHQVVETHTIYDKRDISHWVLSPHGVAEEAQGRVNQYVILRDIGRGAFGRVVLCFEDCDGGRYYACKVISKARIRRQYRFEDDPLTCVKREIAILKKLSKHPNINALVEVVDDETEDNFQSIIHKDIKPENMLLTENQVVQVADFGISHMIRDGDDDLLEDKNSSPAFCPPEACSADTPSIRGRPFDIWSLGVTLYCMVHGRCPFFDESPLMLYDMIRTMEPSIAAHLSEPLRVLLLGMLDKDPEARWDLGRIRSCDWVTKGGEWPLISEDENCMYETDVTEEEIQNVFTKIKKLLSFKNMRSHSRLAVPAGPSGYDSICTDASLNSRSTPSLSQVLRAKFPPLFTSSSTTISHFRSSTNLSQLQVPVEQPQSAAPDQQGSTSVTPKPAFTFIPMSAFLNVHPMPLDADKIGSLRSPGAPPPSPSFPSPSQGYDPFYTAAGASRKIPLQQAPERRSKSLEAGLHAEKDGGREPVTVVRRRSGPSALYSRSSREC
ncbi:Calcium calmodulin-dependent protein kinase kinase 2 [Irineochytrium annulatum]|nr:Calcium calmodulin-dependent protein kinase kinase 2 [Irineochytrium annulatum]